MDSSANAMKIRGLYEAFERGDVSAVLDAFSPDIQWIEAEGFPHGGVYQGPDAVMQNVLMTLGAEWQPFTIAPREIISDGETVVVLGQYSGTYKATGKSFSAPFSHVWRLRDGKIAGFQQFTDTAVVQRAVHGTT
ncbi:MAG TPA: nuclear transport factor 2 family protein [Burkholderiales bacterium]